MISFPKGIFLSTYQLLNGPISMVSLYYEAITWQLGTNATELSLSKPGTKFLILFSFLQIVDYLYLHRRLVAMGFANITFLHLHVFHKKFDQKPFVLFPDS